MKITTILKTFFCFTTVALNVLVSVEQEPQQTSKTNKHKNKWAQVRNWAIKYVNTPSYKRVHSVETP